MEAVRQWAFSICTAMTVCGIARMLLPAGKMEQAFRTTLNLFFLCCLLSPLLLRLPTLDFDWEGYPQSRIEERARRLEEVLESQTESAARWEAAKIVGKKLDEMGINYYDVAINMNNDGQRGLEIESVEIWLDKTHESKHQAIQAELARELGLSVRLGYRSAGEGEENGNR